MSGKMTRDAYVKMVAENREWLAEQPRTLERDHPAGRGDDVSEPRHATTRAEKLAVLADAAEELGLADVAEMLRSGEVPEISPREMDGRDPDGIAWRLRPRRTGQRVR